MLSHQIEAAAKAIDPAPFKFFEDPQPKIPNRIELALINSMTERRDAALAKARAALTAALGR